ncbi:MAG: hypothetical protein FJ098_15735, partial [Deltaproteobacteria bacterium]|nr:hypothetical protein [Deltaproteobacteria bacterium]
MEETCPPRRAPGPPAWAVGLAALLLAAVLQGQAPRLVDVDGYYHARFAQELPDTGFRGFSAVRYGLWAEGFSDKEPL